MAPMWPSELNFRRLSPGDASGIAAALTKPHAGFTGLEGNLFERAAQRYGGAGGFGGHDTTKISIFVAAADFGNQVVIDHGNGIFTQSAHLNMLGVRPGDVVSAGQIIGLSGRTGNVPRGARSHVHYEVRLGSERPVIAGGKVDDPLRHLPPPP
jgi:murein DD-endopeptidase MepM/ murein hydrolase activator NlpD